MQPFFSDSIKHRLTEPADIARLVFHLRAAGIGLEAIPREIARRFYVDLDELDRLLRPLLAAADLTLSPQSGLEGRHGTRPGRPSHPVGEVFR